MFIICVGVGFFGGLNTFAFMAAEVSRRAIVGSPVAPQYFVRHFWIIISRWYFDCTSSVIIDSKREFFLWEIPTHDSSHSSHLHFQFKCIQHKNVNKICISVPLGRMERWRCADETQEKERKLVISVCSCNLQYIVLHSTAKPDARKQRKIFLTWISRHTLILFADRLCGQVTHILHIYLHGLLLSFTRSDSIPLIHSCERESTKRAMRREMTNN